MIICWLIVHPIHRSLIHRTLLVVLSSLAFAVSVNVTASAFAKDRRDDKIADWTVMVFSNGKNGLQKSAACNLHQMLSVDSLREVNIVVQIAFDGDTRSPDIGSVKTQCKNTVFVEVPSWIGTRRFAINNHQLSRVAIPQFTDPRDPRSLAEFVKWAHHKFQARHYMLDLADHGEATPLYLDLLQVSLNVLRLVPDPTANGYALKSTLIETFSHVQDALHRNNDHPVVGLFAADTSPLLKDADIRKHLLRVLRKAKLDIIGFDACSKGTLETAYAMSDIAQLMVASEEVEPSGGWQYDDWLSDLGLHSDSDPQQLTKQIAQSYSDEYGLSVFYHLTSQATLDLRVLKALIQKFDVLASSFLKHTELWPLIHDIREHEIHAYLSEVVDLGTFLSLLDARLSLDGKYPVVLGLVREMRQLMLSFVNQPPYASADSQKQHGSTGVAIFFPAPSFGDIEPPFYNFHNRDAVLFARNHMWSRFLAKFLATHYSQ